MKLRHLFFISTLVTACVLASLALADEPKEVTELSARCAHDDASACANLGLIYDLGPGVVEDFLRAVELFRKACDEGDASGCIKRIFTYSINVKQNSFQAVEFYRKGCDGRSPMGCNNLGVLHEYGKGVKQSDANAFNYYEMACDLKNAKGCENYARIKTR